MVYAARWRKCDGCGEWIHGRYPSLGKVLCITCKLDNARCAATQMANKSGPYYDRWLRGRGPRGRPRTK